MDGHHILIRDDAGSFADAVLELMSDKMFANTLRENGRRIVEERYDWGMIFTPLEQEMLQLVEKNQRKGSGKLRDT